MHVQQRMNRIEELPLVSIQPYHQWLRCLLIRLGLIADDHIGRGGQDEDEDDDEQLIEEYLKTLDPREWKHQDHYAVLGLKHKRFNATEDDIRKAYRKSVLLHHPDKNSGNNQCDNDYFACITKAYETLGDPIKRRAYDSTDPTFDDEIPPNNAHSKSRFFELFNPVFKRNARWSNARSVPDLGDWNSPKEYVEKFYNFWYDFDSWREFSYLDEEEKERGQDREERKWIERQNKAERAKRRKEEIARIRELVDNAYNCDPRISKFKEEEKRKKQEQKKAKEDARKLKAREEEIRKKVEEARALQIKQQEEEELKSKKEKARKEKEALKKLRRKERKNLEQIFEENNYFAESDKQKVEYLQEFDKLCHLLPLDDLVKLSKLITSIEDFNGRREIFMSEVENLNNHIKKEKEEVAALSQKQSHNVSNENCSSSKNWNHDDTQLLIKAVNLFPAGTQSRWEVVAEFINQHSASSVTRKPRDTLSKAKDLQKLDPSLKDEANKNAFKILETAQMKTTNEESIPSERFESPAELQGFNLQPWTNEEQQLLEQALKTYPASLGISRWDSIAESIPTRSKKDCIKRYKELVELVKAKKAAKDAVHTKVKK